MPSCTYGRLLGDDLDERAQRPALVVVAQAVDGRQQPVDLFRFEVHVVTTPDLHRARVEHEQLGRRGSGGADAGRRDDGDQPILQRLCPLPPPAGLVRNR